MDLAVEDAARVRVFYEAAAGGPRTAGSGRFCVLRDPAGAPFALYENGGA